MTYEILVRETDDENYPTSTTYADKGCDRDCLFAANPTAILVCRPHIDRILVRIDQHSASDKVHECFRPWDVFYSLFPFRVLGFDKSPEFPAIQQRMVQFLSHRRSHGLFSGFPDDNIHMVTSHAGISGVALIGTDEAYELIDRQSAYREILACKLPNGAFRSSRGMEHDVRSTFCAILIAAVLNILTPELTENVAEYVLSCECYDGGISPRPGLESHGGYVHCGVGLMKLLNRLDDLNLNQLVRWIATRQLEFSGGFCGRAHKLPDSCYTWWIGSTAKLIAEHLGIPSFWNEDGIAKFVLRIFQDITGGFTSRPPVRVDAFHTLYALAGLCACGRKQEDVELPELDTLIACPKELMERMKAYFQAQPFTPE
jgi:protein farnesyltransferase subunit beta